MATYSPNPYDDSQPTPDKYVETAAAEFRSLKTAVIALAGSAGYLGDWSTRTGAAVKGNTVTHADGLWLLRIDLADITSVEPTLAATATWFRMTQVSAGGYVAKTSNTGSAQLPFGTTAQRDVAPLDGALRRNTDLKCLEVFDMDLNDWRPMGKIRRAPVSIVGSASILVDAAVPPKVKQIEILLNNASGTSTGLCILRVGDSTGYIQTGHSDTSSRIGSTSVASSAFSTGMHIYTLVAGESVTGRIVLTRFGNTNLWFGQFIGNSSSSGAVLFLNGTRFILANELTRLGIETNGGTFDTGEVEIHYSFD